MTERLTPEDWTAAAFAALARGGVAAVRVEPLARALGVSKGSFYWHFKDLSSLFQVMLTTWEDQATERLVALAEGAPRDPVDRLVHLAQMATQDPGAPGAGYALEAAIRDWARVEPAAAAVQARVDRRRLAYLAAAFDAAGRPEPLVRARLLLAAMIGAQALPPAGGGGHEAGMLLLLELLLVAQPSTAAPASPSAR